MPLVYRLEHSRKMETLTVRVYLPSVYVPELTEADRSRFVCLFLKALPRTLMVWIVPFYPIYFPETLSSLAAIPGSSFARFSRSENFADRSVANRSFAITLSATKQVKLESLGLRLTQKPGQPRRKMGN